MKNLLFVTSLGLAVFFTNTAFGQDVKAGDTTKQEKKYNPNSNSKHNPNRTFGKDRAADVKAKNGEAEKIAKNKEVKKVDDSAKKDKAAGKELKKQQKAAKNQEKAARKQEKGRLKAEKKLMKNEKIKK